MLALACALAGHWVKPEFEGSWAEHWVELGFEGRWAEHCDWGMMGTGLSSGLN